MGKQRITINQISGGQPRAYADSVCLTQVLFEVEDYRTGELVPWDLNEEHIRARLLALKQWCGFTDFVYPTGCTDPKNPTTSEYFALRLIYLKKVSPGLWEFKTLSAFTD